VARLHFGCRSYSSNSCAGVTAKCVSWLTPAAFYDHWRRSKPIAARRLRRTVPCPRSATLPRTLFGSKTSNWDVQVSKYFNFSERWKLQIRAEYFNVLNHPNFAPESTSKAP